MKTLEAQRAQVKVCDSVEEFATEAAKEFVRIVNQALRANDRCSVALSGGSTPILLYDQLTSKKYMKEIDWSKVHFFASDERCVPLDDKESNFGNAQRKFLSKLSIPNENMHPVHLADKSPPEAATEYESQIKEFFGLDDGQFPQFDLVLLGMGPDGHCASLFPRTNALTEKRRIVIENRVDTVHAMRITFSFPAINHAKNVMFLVQGKEKSHVLGEVLLGDMMSYPVQHIDPIDGKLVWILDRTAAEDFLKTETGSR